MSLRLILGSPGSGKSYVSYRELVEASLAEAEKQFFVIVPEQFTMQTQKDLVDAHPGGGILNIDVLSFQRLAHRIFEEVGGDTKPVLEDLGKSLVLQKLVEDHKKDLPYLGEMMSRPGCIDEMKSLISEFMQYEVRDQKVQEMAGLAQPGSLLEKKLKEIAFVYEAFEDYLGENYVAAEELLDQLADALPLSRLIKGSTMLFDSFTGFTPVQLKVMEQLLKLCERVWVTVTLPAAQRAHRTVKSHHLFFMSQKMIRDLLAFGAEEEEPLLLPLGEEKGRFEGSPALAFLEQNLFRYSRNQYHKAQEEISLSYADTPAAEMAEVAREIGRLVREEGYTYGQIAVITGNLPEYESIAQDVFDRAGIPYFIDSKHNILMNPFVEYLRSCLDMLENDFRYDTVFRFLRSGMTGIPREEIDRLENYCIARGIRGYRRYASPFKVAYRGEPEEEVPLVDQTRQAFLAQVETLRKALSGKSHTVLECCTALYQFFVDNKVQSRLKGYELRFKDQGNYALEKECGQVYGIILGFLEKMVEILGEAKVSRREFTQLLETGLQKLEIGLIPAGQDQVLVGDMERTRVKSIKALFFVGMNEGSIPKNTDTGGFLTQIDREFLEGHGITLAPDAKERMTIGKFYLYLNMTKPSQRLYLSFTLSSSAGKPLRPAYLVENIQELYPLLPCRRVGQQGKPQEVPASFETPLTGLDHVLSSISSRQEGWEALSTPLFQETYAYLLRDETLSQKTRSLVQAAFTTAPTDVIGRAAAKAVFGDISPYAATQLEHYCACAFQHFLQHGLRLSERATYVFRSLEMGNLMHDALELFSEGLAESELSWEGLSDEERQTRVESAVHDAAQNSSYEVLYSDARTETLIERTSRLLNRTVWMLTTQLQNGQFEPESFEMPVEGGRIDRVDICKQGDTVYVKIIDYKSGSTHFNLSNVYYGLQLQLMLYMDAAVRVEGQRFEGAQVVPAGVFYCNIQDPIVEAKADTEDSKVEEAILGKMKLNGLVLADGEVVRLLDSTTKTIPVSFNKDGSLGARSSAATQEQFQILGSYVKKKIGTCIEEIYEGNAKAIPYVRKNEKACDRCFYKETCCRDRRLEGVEEKRYDPLDPGKLWGKLEQEVAQEAEQEMGQEGGSDGNLLDT